MQEERAGYNQAFYLCFCESSSSCDPNSFSADKQKKRKHLCEVSDCLQEVSRKQSQRKEFISRNGC